MNFLCAQCGERAQSTLFRNVRMPLCVCIVCVCVCVPCAVCDPLNVVHSHENKRIAAKNIKISSSVPSEMPCTKNVNRMLLIFCIPQVIISLVYSPLGRPTIYIPYIYIYEYSRLPWNKNNDVRMCAPCAAVAPHTTISQLPPILHYNEI